MNPSVVQVHTAMERPVTVAAPAPKRLECNVTGPNATLKCHEHVNSLYQICGVRCIYPYLQKINIEVNFATQTETQCHPSQHVSMANLEKKYITFQ